ncbi:Flagellar basal-body rod protein FlgG [bacterium HR40]|nr:Flagellar basal-body rod protein FlgG [bacterium HR40]
MDTTSYIAVGRQLGLAHRLEVIAHNLANLRTPGYKSEQIGFETVAVSAGPPGRLAFVQDVGRRVDLSEGALESTGNPLDFAISGPGFFTFGTPEGPAYGRNGHLRLTPEGTLVGASGAPLVDENGAAVVIPAGSRDVHLAPDGTLSADGAIVARLGLVTFDDPRLLERLGDGLFRTGGTPRPATGGKFVQGMLEASNVEPVPELVRLIDTTRAFEAVQRLIETRHELERQHLRQATGGRA